MRQPVTALKGYLQEEWPHIKEELLAGTYHPQPLRKVEIPKPGGGTRMLGIPTVLDRLIQQAVQQVLNPLFDPGFSESSYGFRPGRSAHKAVKAAQKHVCSDLRWVVDIDLEKFFDRCHHDILMSLVKRKKAVARLKANLKKIFRQGRAKNIQSTIKELTPKLRGWITYFRHSVRHLR